MNWSGQEAFQKLKQILVNGQVLTFPRYDLRSRLESDVSATALGFVFSCVRTLEHLVVYGGKGLRPLRLN